MLFRAPSRSLTNSSTQQAVLSVGDVPADLLPKYHALVTQHRTVRGKGERETAA
jgi:hypothetical protein